MEKTTEKISDGLSPTQIKRLMKRSTRLKVSKTAVYRVHDILIETIKGITEEAEKIAMERKERTILEHQIPEAAHRYRNRVFGDLLVEVIPVLENSAEAIRHLVSLLGGDNNAGEGHKKGYGDFKEQTTPKDD